MDNFQFDYDSLNSRKSAEYFLELGVIVPEILADEYRDHVLTLWNDTGIRSCFKRSNEFQLSDSAK